ncbi:Methyltransferase type 11 [Kribbella flavida DSM 17836]|uniref:Methyltransferase type 11 n=1 Tax=Kribbella flavida (strain DSM 17836 / JCM 10339 / NBRC 14399) TaxID=479435 RepID=D2Q1Z4_KRIFD|nr:class I SAM-dependent methyltransferase [Kribbella flavida]ADB33940.1 Methyltransferase type 11 [Kribbella flavida DSM 17836]
MTETLPLTGERTAPGIWHENYWFARHEAAYRWIADTLSPNGRVLDAGCGEGYGAELLRQAGAAPVFGLDYEGTTLRHVAKAYPQIGPVQGNLVQTGFAGASFDLVTSLQTIEHLWEQPRFVAECARILAPGGTLVLTTPNTLTFPAGNWYHTKELTAAELVDLVRAHFEVVDVLGLWHGPRLSAWEDVNGSCVTAQLADDHQHWRADLQALVTGTSYRDFEIRAGAMDDSLDLFVVARKPADDPA